jgi:hypothetical protein
MMLKRKEAVVEVFYMPFSEEGISCSLSKNMASEKHGLT